LFFPAPLFSSLLDIVLWIREILQISFAFGAGSGDGRGVFAPRVRWSSRHAYNPPSACTSSGSVAIVATIVCLARPSLAGERAAFTLQRARDRALRFPLSRFRLARPLLLEARSYGARTAIRCFIIARCARPAYLVGPHRLRAMVATYFRWLLSSTFHPTTSTTLSRQWMRFSWEPAFQHSRAAEVRCLRPGRHAIFLGICPEVKVCAPCRFLWPALCHE